MKITLYHGSSVCVGRPVFGVGKEENDYGLGFYCTEDLELAREWACFENADGFANRYQLEMEGLSVLYYPRRKSRDETARRLYAEMAADEFLKPGVFMRDIISEKMEADDARLR